MFDRVSPEGVQTLQKVKRIFDPNSILKPGVLCFREGSQ
jgi:FAD/FMN-containing dehydrogenase